ncbi:MAG: TIGR03986 family CRISPR-associated RAMP protein [Actinobacteria bacterium]|nr:TIGR03986 family CRISPR-associated RAMP protein [Actinomycetota bacterium]
MTRVSVVFVSTEHVVFAPHTGVKWITRKLVNDCGSTAPEPGQVGELEEDSSSWIFEVEPGWRIELRSLVSAGGKDSMTFQVKGAHTVIDLTDHGVPLAMKDKAAARLKFWWLVPSEGDVTAAPAHARLCGHFDHPDVSSWVADIEQERAAKEQVKQERRLLHRKQEIEEDPRKYFINPYTFVPFPVEPPWRRKPHGHHALVAEKNAARFAGRITARLVARSPLLVRNVGSAAPTVDGVAKAPRTSTGELFIPGSSLHGAIRSLHETLTGSCLRVFDPDFVPVYRDVASGELRNGWDLGVVDEVNHSGRPIRLTRCDETRWVPLTTLHRAMPAGSPVTTGQRFQLTEKCFSKRNDRQVYQEEASATLDPNGDWVVFVTDDNARQKKYPYYCAVGRLPTTTKPVALTDHAWQEYRLAAEGAKRWFAGENPPSFEAERAKLDQPGISLGDVIGSPKLARGQGRWFRPRQWLHKGQVVWLGPGKGRLVDGVALSYLWRTRGQGSSGDRIPDDFHPCHDPVSLCPSCRVFGSADVRDVSGYGVDRRLAEQRSYRGHVRVMDAVMESGGALDEPVVLPAVGSPRPGSGQFYLNDPQGATEPLHYQKPRNRWGTPDVRQPRHLRGRKFYWHTDPQTDERRGRWRAHDHASQGDQVELVALGSVYRLDVVFDGLTRVEIGSLVATLQPDRVFATQQSALPYPVTSDPEYAIHVGGGKPLGLGSCQVRDLSVVADGIESRYLQAERPALDPAELVADFVAERADLAPTWQKLAAALHTAHVDSRIVSYPTALPWADDGGACSGQEQHEAFQWFQRTTGEELRDGKRQRQRPFVPLPSVTDIAPALPVHVEEDK